MALKEIRYKPVKTNFIHQFDGVCAIETVSPKYGINYVLIDGDDLENVKNGYVFITKSPNQNRDVFYARISFPHGRLYELHRLIMNVHNSNAPLVDHKYGDGLDNRKSNLRVCDNRHNSMNLNKSCNKKTSKYKGVHFCRTSDGWRAVIFIFGKPKWLGIYGIEEDAALAYNNSAKKYFGEFALLNKLPENHIITSKVEYQTRKIIQKNKNGDRIKQWDSIKEASKNGYSSSAIVLCCQGKRLHHKQYKWEYA